RAPARRPQARDPGSHEAAPDSDRRRLGQGDRRQEGCVTPGGLTADYLQKWSAPACRGAFIWCCALCSSMAGQLTRAARAAGTTAWFPQLVPARRRPVPWELIPSEVRPAALGSIRCWPALRPWRLRWAAPGADAASAYAAA